MRNKNKRKSWLYLQLKIKDEIFNSSKSFTRFMKNSETRKIGSTWSKGNKHHSTIKKLFFSFG